MGRLETGNDEEDNNSSKKRLTRRNSVRDVSADVRKEPPREPEPEEAKKEVIDLQGVSLAYYEEMKEIFKIFDADGSGAIDPKEIREQMISLGFTVDNTTIYQLISDLDSDGSQKLEFDEFFGMLRDTLEIHKPGFNSRSNFLEIFDFLDDLDPRNRDGKIDTSNLRRLANVLGDDIPDSEIEIMVRGADTHDRGYVLPEDFYQLMVGCAARMEQEEAPTDDAPTDSSTDASALKSSSPKGRRSLPTDGARMGQRGSLAKLRRSLTQDNVTGGGRREDRQDGASEKSRKPKKDRERKSMDMSRQKSVDMSSWRSSQLDEGGSSPRPASAGGPARSSASGKSSIASAAAAAARSSQNLDLVPEHGRVAGGMD